MKLAERLKRVRLLLMDADGVMTDGKLYHAIDSKGEVVELKGVDSQDGISLVWLAESGFSTGLISGRSCAGLAARARMLRMSHIVQGTIDKGPAFEGILAARGLRPEQAAFIGDDLPDIPALRRAGLAIAVANARPEVRRAAHWTTKKSGGSGAIREVAEALLRSQGLWNDILARFTASPPKRP